ncbi:hypothetical protein [Taibaiella koreensis]|uniref:hypothetical protein n=1 Tax=Taibaiella koreensis TaxID=1268548 RepID=UPI000E59D4FE|nr:hypothetical protein [Taibaiella koreensis]
MIGIVLVIAVLIIAYIIHLKVIKSFDDPQSEPPKTESPLPRSKALKVSEKRFLIVWIGVCSFAFFVNLADLKGHYTRGGNIWTSGQNQGDFWPFTNFTTYVEGVTFVGIDPSYSYASHTGFNGIFNSFDLPEFVFYSFLGLAIVFIPKIW